MSGLEVPINVTASEARRFWAKVEAKGLCWLWTSDKVGGGYGRFWFRRGRILAHRFSWIVSNGPIPDGLHILHECDTPACVRPAHLRVGTDADNFKDSYAKGRRNYQRGTAPRGEEHGRAKLTQAQARGVRVGRAAGLTDQAMADWLGISSVQVDRIATGKSWAWLK